MNNTKRVKIERQPGEPQGLRLVVPNRPISAPGIAGEVNVAPHWKTPADEGFVLVPPKSLLDPPVAPLFPQLALFQEMQARCVECRNLTDRLIKGAGGVLAAGGTLAAAPALAVVLPTVSIAGGLKILTGGALLVSACGSEEIQVGPQCKAFPSIETSTRTTDVGGPIIKHLTEIISGLPETLCSKIKKISFVGDRQFSKLKEEYPDLQDLSFSHSDVDRYFQELGLSHLVEGGRAFLDPSTSTLYLEDRLLMNGVSERTVINSVSSVYGSLLALDKNVVSSLADKVLSLDERALIATLGLTEEMEKQIKRRIPVFFAQYILSGHILRQINRDKDELVELAQKSSSEGLKKYGSHLGRFADVYDWFKTELFNGREYHTSGVWSEMARKDVGSIKAKLEGERG